MLSKSCFSGKIINMNKQGFTLIELLITIAIIGILAGVAVTAYVGTTKKAARSEAYSNLESIRLLEEQVYADNADYAPIGGGTRTGTAAIQGVLPRFRPGDSTNFAYEIIAAAGVCLATPVAVPYAGATAALVPATTPCFIATATGVANSRVTGDVFAIDCNNNRNF